MPHKFFPPVQPITSAVVNGLGRLIITYSDGSTMDAGLVTGLTGATGQRGQGVLVLAAADAVPGGTTAGTLIARY